MYISKSNGTLILTVQRVLDDYTSGGWTKHHTQMLEYEETNTENTKPSILFELADPANDRQKDWEVTIITANRVSYTCCLLLLFEWFHLHLSSLLHILLLSGLVSLYALV